MADIKARQIAELRAKTGIGMMECKKALVEADGDETQAIEILRKKGLDKAAKRAERETKAGIIESYIHSNGRIGVLVEVLSETDFVAQNSDFKTFVHEVALHVAAMAPKYISKDEIPADEIAEEKESFLKDLKDSDKPAAIIEKIVEGKLNKYCEEICLLDQPFVKEPEKKISDLLNDLTLKIGEKIVISRFCRFEIGL